MQQKSPWEAFFDAHAPVYEENEFTSNTLAEVDFLLKELDVPPDQHVDRPNLDQDGTQGAGFLPGNACISGGAYQHLSNEPLEPGGCDL